MNTTTNPMSTAMINAARMTEKESLRRLARNYGVRGPISRMTIAELRQAIDRRRAYLAKPAADLPKKPAARASIAITGGAR